MALKLRVILPGAIALALTLAVNASAEPARSPNIVVFLVDMLRPDHLGLYGYSKNTSPNLDRLGQRGVVFENARAAAPWTLPSTVSLLTGLLPSEHGARDRRVDEETRAITYPAEPAVWLPRRFAEHGYDTVAFHSHAYLLRSVSSIHKAFKEYYYTPAEKGAPSGFKLGTPQVNEHMYLDTLYPPVERWLDSHSGRPFLMYIHVIDVRGPYKELHLLDEDRGAVKRGLANGTLAFPKQRGLDMYQATDIPHPDKSVLYDGHIRFVDDYLGKLHRKLEALGIADDTYLVFTSDHGEGFGEHRNDWGHGKYVYDANVRVPLVLLSHRSLQAAPRRIASHVNTVGLLPTLAALAGIELEGVYAKRSFQRLLESTSEPSPWKYPSVSSGSYGDRFDAITLDGRYKLISDRQSGAREFFDLREDPGERRPMDLDRQPAEIRARLDRLVAVRLELERSTVPAASEIHELDEDSIRALEALGYLQ